MRTSAHAIMVTGVVLFVLLVLGIGNARATEDPVRKRNFDYAQSGHDVATDACKLASALTEPLGYSLQVAHLGSKAETPTIPVYLVAPAADSATTPAAVPQGCRCIFVDPESLTAWVAAHSNGSASLKLSEANLLAFMLLHEVGHIHGGTSAVRFDKGALAQLNVSPSRAKAIEEDADAFAAKVIAAQLKEPRWDASLAANKIAMELTKLSWNMQAYRTLDEFAAAAVGSRTVFFDTGYSHPNLAWRILRSNDLIHQTESTRALLAAFEGARERGSETSIIYRKEAEQPHAGSD